ncbi:MAG: DUF3459 domain-containing protein, partial [Candidatus Marinimicrobia bacterium]|nr:DUF3459 domain-containing protein [Candidatus Neomarinimicrobiota bacterium]
FSSSGDFQGLIDGLDGLKDLGVTILWLMPIHPIGKELRKGRLGSPYSIRDYYAVNPDFGTLDDFERLVMEVHHRDMRIILDMVPNHSAWDNTLLQEHPEWFSRDASGQIVAPNSDWTDVADFNYEQPGLQKYIRDMLNWWVREYDVDGFRIDVAELMPADFWAETRTSLKAADPDIFLLAEGSRPYLHVSGFDATYAFNTFNKFISLANGFSDVSAIHQTMKAEQGSYPQGSLRMRFLENHDQRRAAEVIASEQRLVAASVGIFLLPGLPMLYNGSELGLDHRLELFDRDPIQWDTGSEGYRSLLRELFALRKQYPALINGEYRPHDVAPNVLAYSRHHGNESVLVLVNFGEQKVNVELPTVANLIGELLLSTDGIIYLPDENLVILEPFSGAVLR